MDSRYSVTRGGIGHQGALGTPRGYRAVWGCQGCIGGLAVTRYSVTRRGIGHWGTPRGCRAVWGC